MVSTEPQDIEGIDPVTLEILDRLIKTYHPERIYLFGSKARVEAGPDSDYDFLLVMPDDTSSELLSSAPAYHALWGLKAAADIVIFTREKFDSRLSLRSSLPSTVVREGKLLYAA